MSGSDKNFERPAEPSAAVSQSEGAPPEKINMEPLTLKDFIDEEPSQQDENNANYKLIMGVPLTINVEIGRTKKSVKDIIEMRQGTVIELDKQAGDPADIIVNGQLLARGDVVVIDDGFGVRVTEIIEGKGLEIE